MSSYTPMRQRALPVGMRPQPVDLWGVQSTYLILLDPMIIFDCLTMSHNSISEKHELITNRY